MRPQIDTSTLIVWAITLTRFCSASSRCFRDGALSLPRPQVRNAAPAETDVPEKSPIANGTTISYTASTSSAISTGESLATTTADPLASSACFPMMAQVDAINSCGKRYGYKYDVHNCDGKGKSFSIPPCPTTASG